MPKSEAETPLIELRLCSINQVLATYSTHPFCLFILLLNVNGFNGYDVTITYTVETYDLFRDKLTNYQTCIQ